MTDFGNWEYISDKFKLSSLMECLYIRQRFARLQSCLFFTSPILSHFPSLFPAWMTIISCCVNAYETLSSAYYNCRISMPSVWLSCIKPCTTHRSYNWTENRKESGDTLFGKRTAQLKRMLFEFSWCICCVVCVFNYLKQRCLRV